GSRVLDASSAILMPFLAHRVFGWQPVEIDATWGLNTIKPGHAYSICNSLQCRQCGHLFLDIRFSAREMGRLYRDYRGEAYVRLRDHYEPGYRARNAQLESGVDYRPQVEGWLLAHMPMPASVLDWGGDTGINTPFARRAERVHVFDISDKDVVAGIRRVSREEIALHDYDLVTCCRVLEHVPYPHRTLLDIRDAMHDRCSLYLEVPFEDLMHDGGGDPLTRKKHWHEHINFFSEASLTWLVENCGFRIEATGTLQVTTAGKTAMMLQLLLSAADAPETR
ncbi:MAG: class I SAM-dependent methyltransferase, partial [Flavobacteriales bacterium]